MVRFAHLADIHLGGWKQPELQEINLQSFKKAIEICINEKVEFVLIVGDLFDSAYPPIEVLKETFAEFKKLKDSKIPCFIVAGSHDYSVSGKTFLDVLEKAGFCKNVENFEEKDNFLILNPTILGNVALYGYPGKKSGLEIEDLRRIKFNDTPGLFKILMLHTTLDKAKGTLPIDSISIGELPKADYYALGHLHIDFQYQNFVYPGPIFPNNFQELEDLQYGSFYIIDTNSLGLLKKIELRIKEVEPVEVGINNSLIATERIISELDKRDINDKIVLLRICGLLESGSISDIKFQRIEEFAKSKGAYFILRNTHDLETRELVIGDLEVKDSENIESDSIKSYSDENPSDFNKMIPLLMNPLSIEKQEGEKTDVFTNRLMESAKKVLRI